jgi:hypothetical protein
MSLFVYSICSASDGTGRGQKGTRASKAVTLPKTNIIYKSSTLMFSQIYSCPYIVGFGVYFASLEALILFRSELHPPSELHRLSELAIPRPRLERAQDYKLDTREEKALKGLVEFERVCGNFERIRGEGRQERWRTRELRWRSRTPRKLHL